MGKVLKAIWGWVKKYWKSIIYWVWEIISWIFG